MTSERPDPAMMAVALERQAREEAWLARIREGDEHAFERLVRACYDMVLRMAARYVGQHELAEEVAQDVFVRVWERRDVLQIRTGLVAYLLGAARNRALNAISPMRERAVHIPENDAIVLSLSGDAAPDIVYDATELSQAMRATVEQLSPRVREVFLLSRRDGLTPAQIAEALSISVQTVYTLLGRALKQLQETVERMS